MSSLESTNPTDWVGNATIDVVVQKLKRCFGYNVDAVKFNQILSQVSTYLSNNNGKNEFGLTMSSIINYIDPNGGTSFIVQAAAASNIEMVKTLIKYNVDVNLRPEHGVTAMHYACAKNSPEMVQLLLENGAIMVDYQSKTWKLEKWFINTIKNNNVEICKLLIDPIYNNKFKYQFDWNNQINNENEHLFLLCCKHNSLDCLKYLFKIEKNFETKMDIFGKNKKDGYTSLHMAFSGIDTEELIDYLMTNVYNTTNNNVTKSKVLSMMYDCKTQFNENVMLCAFNSNGTSKKLFQLLTFGVNPNNFGHDENSNSTLHETPIMRALYCPDCTEILKLLFNESKQFKYSFDWVCAFFVFFKRSK